MAEVLLDNTCGLPFAPWLVLASCEAKWMAHVETYNAMFVKMVADGWIFGDLLDGVIGRDEDMQERCAATNPADGGAARFAAVTAGRFGNNEIGGVGVWTTYVQDYAGVSAKDDSSWRTIYILNAFTIFTFGSAEDKFCLGMSTRLQTRMHQLRLAKCAEHILCLDERGRPVLQ